MPKGGARVGAGRRRKAPEAKIAAGTYRADREASDKVSRAGGMVAPVYLSPAAAIHFDRLAMILDEQARASPHHAPIVAELARVLELIDTLQKTIASDGASYTTVNAHGGTMVRARPEMAMLTQAQKQSHALLTDLMLTPSSAMRLAAPKKKSNAFADL